MDIRLDIEHKTVEIGASFDTDYKVITQCVPDCPACAAERQLRAVLEWLGQKNMMVVAHKEVLDSVGEWAEGMGVGRFIYLTPEDWQALHRGLEKPSG